MNRPLAAALGLLADRALGEPPLRPHPVAALGAALERVERRVWRDSRPAGAVHAGLGLGLGVAAGTLLHSTALTTYLAVAGRALSDAALDVRSALATGDLDRARALLPTLVGRDPTSLDEAGICRAVVESVAENTVDAVVAPTLWGAAFGARGAAGHRVVDTLDSMVGYRADRYRRFGWASARLDDAAAWVPARVTAALVAAARPDRAGDVWRVVRRDAAAHPSPNAGVAEAAFAAALGVRLGGTNRYGDHVETRAPLGDGPPPTVSDIDQAVRLSRDVAVVLAAGLAALGWWRR